MRYRGNKICPNERVQRTESPKTQGLRRQCPVAKAQKQTLRIKFPAQKVQNEKSLPAGIYSDSRWVIKDAL